ncbi:MAG: glutaredoxin family protein [Halobacteriota archaeon]
MGQVEFYALAGCPYCARVERVLDELDVPYERHEVPPDHADRTHLRELTGRTQVPAIVDRAHGIEGMVDSDAIIRHLRSTYGQPERAE